MNYKNFPGKPFDPKNFLHTLPGTDTPASASVADWVRARLAFEPDSHQTAILNPTIRRGLLNCSRQWGKSTVAAAKAVHHAATNPGSLTLVVSPSARQSGELVRKSKTFAEQGGFRIRGGSGSSLTMQFPNKARIIGLPGMESTIRGYSAVSLLLVDEAARVSDEIYAAVRPMLAVTDGALWLMSTPAGKSGFFWEAFSATAYDDDWTRFVVPATECPRIKQDYLDRERRKSTDRYFRQEFMCEFADSDDAVFSTDLIEAAFSSDFEPLNL